MNTVLNLAIFGTVFMLSMIVGGAISTFVVPFDFWFIVTVSIFDALLATLVLRIWVL